MSNIAIVTTSRADWGLLAPLYARLAQSSHHVAKLIVTGQHVYSDLGAFAGYHIDELIECSCDQGKEEAAACGISASILENFGHYLSDHPTDLVVVLGDRFEMLSVSLAAVINRVPLAHIFGGDTTLGAIDNSIRHAISKLASLHFPSNESSAAKLIAMGEPASRIVVSGSTGIDMLSKITPMSRDAFLKKVGLTGLDSVLLVAYHPETLADHSCGGLEELLLALRNFPDSGFLFTGTNLDPGHGAIKRAVSSFIESHEKAAFFESLGSELFGTALKHCDAIVGNSSAGILEAPYFGTPTVNIGNRQTGRRRGPSVIDVAANAEHIDSAIRLALKNPKKDRDYFFGEGNAAEIIASTLEGFDDFHSLLRKEEEAA